VFSGAPALPARDPLSVAHALALSCLLFFAWGFVTALNDILIPVLERRFELGAARAMLVQLAFFGAFFSCALPAARAVERLGFRGGIVLGLAIAAGGALAFVPAAWSGSFFAFLAALFVLAAGITVLQVAANPYVTLLGDPDGAASRLNLTQGINSLGTTVAPLLGAWVMLGSGAVVVPYLMIAGVLAALALLFAWAPLPQPVPAPPPADDAIAPRLPWLGALAIFLYVGAEVGIGSSLVFFFALPEVAGMDSERAGYHVSLYWGGAMIGRFVGALLQRWIAPARLLAAAAALAIALVLVTVTVRGPLAVWSLLAVGLANSIMFPTIFSLALAGRASERASALLVMAIVGGAVVPLAIGALAEHAGYPLALATTMLAYGYVGWFAWRRAAPPRV
jgi:MFS transporter, FHS family, L-fucose permease